jgi:hypothetical protein
MTYSIHELWPDKDTFDWKPDMPTSVPLNADDESPTKPPSAHDIKVNRWLHDKAELKFGGAALEAQETKEAFEASEEEGATVADKQRAAVKQANIDQDAQAKADQNHKLAVVKNNLETHQLAMSLAGR